MAQETAPSPVARFGPARFRTRPVDLAAYATDASLYRIVPRAVVRPRDVEDVRALLAHARRESIPLTFRAAGTSLCGQALGTGFVVDVSRDWRQLEVLDGGRRVRVGPGVIGGLVNRRVAPHGFKLGPDPASIDSCMIGGIVANNSSGMCCGIERNAYRTLESLVFVLASGTVVDSAASGASARLQAEEPEVWRGIASLRDRVRADGELTAKIERKYRMKNTMGYSLNAFLDFEDPLEILWHLLVGSEGTLAFLAEATFSTVPDLPHKATGLLFFADVRAACAAIAPLRATGAAALELMDRASLRSVEGKPGVPSFVSSLPGDVAAILVEHEAADSPALDRLAGTLDGTLLSIAMVRHTPVTREPGERAALWAVRKGIIPSVGAVRRRGTTLITEDVVFPVESLADGVLELQRLFRKHGYGDSVIFGHAKDGNLHFLLSQGMNDPREIDALAAFSDDLAALVVDRHGGALKAEHGTGRAMAPYLEREWGPDAVAIMRGVKRLLDPAGILNPGVVLNDDPRGHLVDLKTIPEVDEETDRCIECGFCESRCPSRDLTLSPRQRILVRRERERLLAAGRRDDARELDDGAAYEVLHTCATDGLCATACPVSIDTGRLVKRLREERHGALARAAADLASARFALVETAARTGLRIGRSLRAPASLSGLPPAAGPLPPTPAGDPAAVYYPSCVTRTLGAEPGEASVAESLVVVSARAGVPVRIPPSLDGTCCGMPFSSKGFSAAHARLANALVAGLWKWSEAGRLPIVVDTSPCTWSLRTCRDVLDAANRERWDLLRLLDGVEFAHDVVLPRLTIARRRSVALHPVCSVVKLGLEAKLRAIGRACADEAFVAVEAGCCAFAGDRGITHPELTESATRREAAELVARAPEGGYATSRTCEIGMERATGRPWRSIWHLLEETSRG